MKRVFITGIGVIAPNAVGYDNFAQAIKDGKNGISKLESFDCSNFDCNIRIAGEVKDFNPELYMDKKESRRHDRHAQLALCAANMAGEMANLRAKNFDPERAGSIVSTGVGGIHTFEAEEHNCTEHGYRRVTPFLVPRIISNIAAGCIALEFGMMGPSYAIVSACASAMHAIGESYLKIVHDDCDLMICGGAEAPIIPLTVAGFAKIKALSTRNDEPERASRPFDVDRDGFVMSEGASILVLESEESAIKRGSKILAEVKGYGASDDAYHMTAPHPEGLGAAIAMKKAINYNKFPIERINYINAHGTSTHLGDIAEVNAIRKVFDNKLENVTINSTKSMVGHLLGAAGALGVAATVAQIQGGFVHPNVNLENIDPELASLDLVPLKYREKKIDGALVNSFGFGGQNASVLVTRAE